MPVPDERSILAARPPEGAGLGRGRPGERDRLAAAARSAAAEWSAPSAPVTAPGSQHDIWTALAALGRRDLVLGRLVEGHADAVSILAQAGRKPVDGAAYGVWASGSLGTGLRAEPAGDGWRLAGQLRYCTGARWVDRALVTARTTSGPVLLLDLPVGAGWAPVADSWAAVGMDLSDSLDIDVDVAAAGADRVGEPGFYLDRPGFALGGIGVAAVWLGGAAGVLDTIAAGLRRFEPDPHQLAHLGAMAVALQGADAVLARAAARHAAGERIGATDALAARAAVDAAVEVVLRRAPRLTGPTPLCRDGDFAHRLADLGVYVRQQHAERDLAELGRRFLDA